MEPDTELESWRRQWQRDDGIPADLQQRVERETRNLRLGRYAEIAVTAIIGGGATAWALVSQRSNVVVLAIGVWVLIAIAWAMAIGLRRDILQPSAPTTAAFLDLSIRRCRNRLRGLVAQCVLYVIILTFDLVWIYHYQAGARAMEPRAFLTSGGVLVVWAVTGMLAVAAVWYRRRQRDELQNLLTMRRQLGDSEGHEIHEIRRTRDQENNKRALRRRHAARTAQSIEHRNRREGSADRRPRTSRASSHRCSSCAAPTTRAPSSTAPRGSRRSVRRRRSLARRGSPRCRCSARSAPSSRAS